MIIFFDWDNKGHSGPQDGQSDHVGIVWKVEDGIIYTVEGNSGAFLEFGSYTLLPVIKLLGTDYKDIHFEIGRASCRERV